MKKDITKDFWGTLPKPFFCLAPMADVTDAAFRRIIVKYGKPDVVWTEFVSADGLFKGGYDALSKDLHYTEAERPIVVQFFSKDPAVMRKAGKLAADLGFDGVDINMGCPDETVCKQGAGAAIIKDPALAKELIQATKAGVVDSGRYIPVSVKTRSGFSRDEVETWLPELLSQDIAALTLHARTKKDMSKVPARWELIQQAVMLRDRFAPQTKIIGNGDVRDCVDARQKAAGSGCDGVMVGRGIFGNPWFFSGHTPSIEERLCVLVEHARLFEELVSHKGFHVMKKHFKAYVEGFPGAKELRAVLMEEESADGVSSCIERFLRKAP